MNERRRNALLSHGLVVLLLGLLLGFPFATAIGDGGDVRAWRMAHMEGILNGLLLVAIAAAGALVRISARMESLLYRALLVTGYGNVLAAALAASTGNRGLAPAGPLVNWIVFLGFTAAVLTVLFAVFVLLFGARSYALSSGD